MDPVFLEGIMTTRKSTSVAIVLGLGALLALATAGVCRAAQPKRVDDRGAGPWPVQVQGHVPVAPGEHPRLLFRESDLEKLRERARTPEGQAILERLKMQLDGSDGKTLPSVFVTRDASGKTGPEPGQDQCAYTFSHAAGYGLLFRLTGERQYADLGRQCMDKALDGVLDRDPRYSFRRPSGALRAGPVLGWTALGYDLCYEGWDEAYRHRIAGALANYSEGQWCSLPELTRGERQHPGSNHWGMQVGGAAMALLAIMGDPGVDMPKIKPLLEQSQQAMLINLTQGFGSGGFFAEGDGTGSMSSHIVFLSALQAWRTAAGKDFYTPRPNARWMALKWFFLTSLGGDPMDLRASFPERGDYPHNIWARTGLSGGSYFSVGFGLATEGERAAMLWFYNHSGLRAADAEGRFGLDAPSPYPHHSVLSLVNWPIGAKEQNPGEVLPHALHDNKWNLYAWRNRWQDKGDAIISILTERAKGNMEAKAERCLSIQHAGRKLKWGTISGGFRGDFAPAPDGSTILTTGDGSCLAVDFSGASGADALLVMTGPGAPADHAVEAGGMRYSFLMLGGAAPECKVEDDRVVLGRQTVSLDGGRIVLGVFARPRR
jgi:hypothetical protein